MHPRYSTCNWKSSTLDIIWHNVTTAWQQHPYHDDQKPLNKNGLHYFGQETPSCGCSMGGWGPRHGYQCHGVQQISISLVSVPVFPSVSSSLKNWKASLKNQLARFSAASLTFDHTNQVSHFILKSDFQREYPSSQKKEQGFPNKNPRHFHFSTLEAIFLHRKGLCCELLILLEIVSNSRQEWSDQKGVK